MVVYNLYLVLNDDPIKIYDKCTQTIVFEGSSNNIPDRLMDRYVHSLTITQNPEDYSCYQLIVID